MFVFNKYKFSLFLISSNFVILWNSRFFSFFHYYYIEIIEISKIKKGSNKDFFNVVKIKNHFIFFVSGSGQFPKHRSINQITNYWNTKNDYNYKEIV